MRFCKCLRPKLWEYPAAESFYTNSWNWDRKKSEKIGPQRCLTIDGCVYETILCLELADPCAFLTEKFIISEDKAGHTLKAVTKCVQEITRTFVTLKMIFQ